MKVILLGVTVFWMAVLALAVPRPSSGSEADNPASNKETAAENKGGTSPKKIQPSAQEDRPWIIKKHPRKKSDTPKEKPVSLEWKSDLQRSACEDGLKKFKKTLEKARTYSIRGDLCATARHAKDFLDQEGRLRNECPAGFLESNGYSEKIIQNVRVLLELGKKACLEKE